MEMIVLTTEQADQVKGRYGKYSMLSPVEFNNIYVLPIDVIDDPEFATVSEFLKTLPTQDIIFPEE